MDIKRTVLPSGLRLLTIPIPSIESVACIVLTGVGSRYEKKERLGISHVLEHMAFKGTKKRPKPLDIANLIEGVGGEMNAYTSNEMTVYWIKVSAEHLELPLDVLSDILTNPVLDADELKKEIGVIKEEKKMYYDTPARHVLEMSEEQVFGDQPLGWGIIGTYKSLDSITRADVKNYIDTYYKSENMVVAIAGKIPGDIESRVEKYFASLLHGKTPTYLAANTVQLHPKVKIDKRPIEQANLALSVEGVARLDEDYLAFEVMNTFLGQGMSSRLFTSVREKKGLAYSVRSYAEGYHDTGIFTVHAGVDVGKVELAVQAIMDELRLVAKEPVGKEELKKAKEFIKGRIKLGLEDTSNVAETFGLQELLEKRILTVEEISNKVDRVTEGDVLRVAKRIFKTEKLNLALVGPIEDQEKFLNLLKI